MAGDWEQHTVRRRLRTPTEPTDKLEPPDTHKALLIAVLGGAAGRTYTISRPSTVIGRGSEVDICLAVNDVSRRHAVIRNQGGQFSIEDLDSRNGTLVNGVFVERQPLRYGDKVRIGSSTLFVFSKYDSLEDQLLQIQRLESIGQLAGGVAHDFNNILGVLLANVGFLQGLSPGLTLGEINVKESLKDIETSAKRAVEVTRQLLSLSRGNERQQSPLQVRGLIDEVVRLLRRALDPAIRMTVEGEEVLQVTGDPGQLQQMLMNLCINARDAMPQGGTLTISCDQALLSDEQLNADPLLAPGPYVRLAVRDTGVGMDDKTKRRAFEPFFTTKSRTKGTGLGLFTVMQIVRQHGGTVAVESEVGQGTLFEIFLPHVEQQSQTVAMRPAVPVHTLEMRQRIILLVDDDEGFRTSTRRLLEGMGFPVKAVASGVEAVQLYPKIRELVDLVLLDIAMPEMNGPETYEELRRLDPQVKVLIVSGMPDISGARELLARGVVGFLQKPYDAATLQQTIAKILYPAV